MSLHKSKHTGISNGSVCLLLSLCLRSLEFSPGSLPLRLDPQMSGRQLFGGAFCRVKLNSEILGKRANGEPGSSLQKVTPMLFMIPGAEIWLLSLAQASQELILREKASSPVPVFQPSLICRVHLQKEKKNVVAIYSKCLILLRIIRIFSFSPIHAPCSQHLGKLQVCSILLKEHFI